ncbi:MAG: hypothetical protein Q9226_004573 [Calogaya cf. arnoldii]
MERLETTQLAVAEFYNFASKDASFLAFAAEDAEAWEPMRTAAVSTRERITTARNSILKLWPEAAAQGLMPEGASFQTLSSMRKVAKHFPYHEGKQRLVSVMFLRLSQPGVGVRQTTNPTKKDWDRVLNSQRYLTLIPEQGMLTSNELRWNQHGLLERMVTTEIGLGNAEPATNTLKELGSASGERSQTQTQLGPLSPPTDSGHLTQADEIPSTPGLTISLSDATKVAAVPTDITTTTRICICTRVPNGFKRRLDGKKQVTTPVAMHLLREMEKHVSESKAEAILQSLGLDWVLPRFHKDGNVLIDGIFMYLFDDGALWALLSEEFDMYNWHLRRISGRGNLGWLRDALYTQVQQLVRGDPLYYILYACLRPDNNWRLISYPYYMKSTQVEDSTYFRHLDVNVPLLLLGGQGACQIQGTLTLTDETEDNCTEMLIGAHRWLPKWWDRIKQRKLDTNGHIHRIEPGMWTAEDIHDFGVDWKVLPCKKGTVRISMPHNPHGSKGPATGLRQTILPWFIGINDDNETLDIEECGTRSNLAAAHRDMIAPPNSPSGHPNKYGVIPFQFPAAVVLCNVSPVADALVGRRLWDSPAVIAERNILLGPDKVARDSLIREIRAKALVQARCNIQLLKQMERQSFGRKSYWYCKEAGQDWVSDDDEDPDSETEAAYRVSEETAAAAEGTGEESEG